jgi:hypothetical protein
VTFGHSPEQAVGQRVFTEVDKSLVVNLEGRDVGCARKFSILDFDEEHDGKKILTGLGDGLLGVGLNGGRLVALGVEPLVVDDLDAGVVGRQQSDLVGNGLSISEGGNVLANVGEAQNESVGVGTGELSLSLLAENHNIGVGVFLENTASSLAQTGVDTTAKTLVGAGDDEQSLLVVDRLGLGLLENGVGGLTIDARVTHSLLGAGKTGRSNDLHGVGDLLNVLDGFETALDFTQSREVGGIGRSSASQGLAIDHHVSRNLPQVPNRSLFFPYHFLFFADDWQSVLGDGQVGVKWSGRELTE